MVRIYKIRELRKMSNEELRKRLQDITASQLLLKGKKMAGGGTNPGEWFKIKKEKARIKTILRERELGIR